MYTITSTIIIGLTFVLIIWTIFTGLLLLMGSDSAEDAIETAKFVYIYYLAILILYWIIFVR